MVGFDVQADGQDFSLVGMPYPDLPELVAASDARVAIPAFGTAMTFAWEVRNVGEMATGRTFVDLVIVTDRSGSMKSPVTRSLGTRTKLQVLQRSTRLFLDLLRQGMGDRLGQVAFAGSSSVIFDDGSGVVKDFGAADLGTARGAVNGLTVGGSTNIRDALQDAINLIPSAGDRRRVVVFLSDGMKTAGGDPTEMAFLNQFDTKNVKVFSVGFGTEGASGNAGLDLPETQTDGVYGGEYEVTRIPGAYTFTTRVEALLPDCSPVVRQAVHTVSVGGNVDRKASQIDVTEGQGGTYYVTVIPKDGAGNLVGPGLAHSIRMIAKGLRAVDPLGDELDGRYRQAFAPEGDGAATIEVVALGAGHRRDSLLARAYKQLIEVERRQCPEEFGQPVRVG